MRVYLLILSVLSLLVPAVSRATPMQSFTDDEGKTLKIAQQPLRVVSLHDLDITLPLLELGVIPVGSQGRTAKDGSHYLRSAKLLTGQDFDNSPIEYIGTSDMDLEKIASLHPDLIIAVKGRNAPLNALSAIAPTVTIDHLKGGAARLYQQLATLTGRQARLEILQARYQAQLAELKQTLGSRKLTASVISANNGKINLMRTYHALGQVLRDAGFSFPPIIDAIPEDGRLDLSAEQLPDIDADLVFDTWRSDIGGKPEDEVKAMNTVLPGWCQFLTACQRGNYVLLSRESAISNSYAAMGLMAGLVQSRLASLSLPAVDMRSQ